MLWNQAPHTDKEVTVNRPDVIIKNKKEKTCTLIDVAAVPAEGNVTQEEAERKFNTRVMYRDTRNVEYEMSGFTVNYYRYYNLSHRNSNRSLKKNLEAMSRKYSVDSLQKTSMLGTSHIIREVLQSET